MIIAIMRMKRQRPTVPSNASPSFGSTHSIALFSITKIAIASTNGNRTVIAYDSNHRPAASNPMIASITMKVLISVSGDFDMIVESLNLRDGTANAVVF